MAKSAGGAGRAGRAEFRSGNPGVTAATRGTFSIESTVNRSLGGFTSPSAVGVNRFSGRVDLNTKRVAANKAFQMATFEVGARRAAGQKGLPNQRQLRSDIDKIFGL